MIIKCSGVARILVWGGGGGKYKLNQVFYSFRILIIHVLWEKCQLKRGQTPKPLWLCH